MSERTLKVDSPHIRGGDVEAWQRWLKDQFAAWDINYPVAIDGDYGVATRSATASMCEAMGLVSPYGMANGVTPELRIKLRNRQLTASEQLRFRTTRVAYRANLRKRYQGGGVAMPTPRVTQDSWGYHPPGHDGLDLITPAEAPLYAMCDGVIIRADPDGWWGKGAPSGSVKAKGDGIIILRATKTVGPIKTGMNLCYGHAEHATVKAGQHVKSGDRIGRSGLANAWHIHLMVNRNNNDRGVGTQDPRPIYNYVRKHA